MTVRFYVQLSLDGLAVDPYEHARARADRVVRLSDAGRDVIPVSRARRLHHARLRGDPRNPELPFVLPGGR